MFTLSFSTGWTIPILSFSCILQVSSCTAQKHFENSKLSRFDSTEFYDSAHHWYDINDEEKIITPDSIQKRYSSSELVSIADNIILFQKANGGWPKNYDMQAILSEEQKGAVLKSKNESNTTFDNGATHSQLKFLAIVYSATGIEKFKEAFNKGIEFVLSAQYENGGWPQYYPDRSGYRKYITFNDGAMIGIMKIMKKIVDKNKEFSFVDNNLYERVKIAYEKGIECILKCQINENGILTAWCQQHDNLDFHPQNARSFELASITNGESSEIVKFLMSIDKPDEKIRNSITSAVKWFESTKIIGIRVENIEAPKEKFMYHSSEYDKVVVEDPNAKPIWTRFYELNTHKPMFCNRDGIVVYSLAEVERERRTGYAWYIYDPQEVLNQFSGWSEKWLK